MFFFQPDLLHGTHARPPPWYPCEYSSHFYINTYKMYVYIFKGLQEPEETNTFQSVLWWKNEFTPWHKMSTEMLNMFTVLCFLLWLIWRSKQLSTNLSGVWSVSPNPPKSCKVTLIVTVSVRMDVWCTKWGPTSPWWTAWESAAAPTPEMCGGWDPTWDSSSSSCRRSAMG